MNRNKKQVKGYSKEIHIYTDGAIHIKRRLGGWGFCSTFDKGSKLVHRGLYGKCKDVTSNQMELQAVIEAIIYSIKNYKGYIVNIYSDSQYVSDNLYLGTYKTWLETNRLSSGGVPKNLSYWKQLDKLTKEAKVELIDIKVFWVRGHNGNYFNEYADMLARLGKNLKYGK